MIVDKIYDIPSCDDVELGLARTTLLNFALTYDDKREPKAILFIISGLGADAQHSYREHLAHFAAREFDVAVVSANYHCIGNRPQTGARFVFDGIDQLILTQKCAQIGIPLTNTAALATPDAAWQALETLDRLIATKKQNGELAQDFALELSLTMQPTKDEYQNFGIMQATDLLNALLFVQNRLWRNLPVVMLGSSHGGYLAHMAAKLAPWLISGVIDNSCYARYPFRFIGFGKQIDYTQHFGFWTDLLFKNIQIYASDRTLWTLEARSPYYFSEAREEIRYLLQPEHLLAQSALPRPIYVSYHSVKDERTAPATDKIELYRQLRELGFDATLNLIEREEQVDGKFIKTLDHGMQMSIKSLISRELPAMLNKLAARQKPLCATKNVSYKSADKIYKFSEAGDRINLEISDA